MALGLGIRVGPYEIVAPLGAGGMGEVYRARDTRLGRDVAIKVLRAEVTGDPERVKRFEKEARTVASLSHPNILALFDVGSHEGQPYLVTELLEGQTLAERIRAGDLMVAKAVELGTQIAHGLAAAHEHGVVHRDLKPGNVFVTRDGVVKILDFGLARLTHLEAATWDPTTASTETGLTGAHTVLGTVGYMAPEQVRGQPADHRSDIFAFGCVLYEMLCGKSAFRRDTAADTSAAILHEEAPSLASAVKGLPPQLEAIVTRCLEKRPEDRFQSARDLAHDLGAIVSEARPSKRAVVPAAKRLWRVIVPSAAAVAVLAVAAVLVLQKVAAPGRAVQDARRPKIVVLPFENLGLPEDAYFASGMAEEITSRLANVQGLGVISRTTAAQYEHTKKTVKQIGADLGVDYVLEGSVRWEHGQGRESRVRITPQLIRVADDTHVWADRYDRVLADVFAIQSEVAESAVRAMGVKLLPPEKTALQEISTDDLEAYNLYLQGVELLNRGFNREFVEGALQKFQAAVDRDPRFAQALAMLASQHLTIYWLHYDHSPERLAKGKELAERAVELRPDLAETHGALAQYYYHGLLDYPRALDELATARKIQPSNTMVLLLTGLIFNHQGRWGEAAEVMGKAVELDPRNPSLLGIFAASCVRIRRYADADRAFGLAIALSPQWGYLHAWRVELQIKWHGDLDKAQALLEEASRVPGLKEDFAGEWQWVALARRDYPEVLRQIEAQESQVRDDPAKHSDLLLSRGQVQMLMGQGDLARRSYEAARVELEKKIAQDPNDAELHRLLGIAYAGLGRRAEAVREAKLACDLAPASKDALAALGPLDALAQVYTMVGQPGEAIAVLDDRLSRMGSFTPHLLRLDPVWDPLRSDPRFQALLKKHEVKE